MAVPAKKPVPTKPAAKERTLHDEARDFLAAAQGADADKALVHAYSPRRRSVMWNVGNGLIGCMGLGPRPFVGEDIACRDDWSPYQKLFVERLRIEAARSPDDAREPAKDAKTGLLRESFSKAAAARAKRYVEKRFLCDLWVAWRAVAR